MSRRQFTTLKLLVSLPLPAGMTQKRALETVTYQLKEVLKPEFATHEFVIKQVGKEVTYL